MKKLMVQEKNGHFHLENFGAYYCGENGSLLFTLVIEGHNGLRLEFPEVSVFDLFARFDLHGRDFMRGHFRCPDFVRLRDGEEGWEVEVPCGTLYDFFKERVASGFCELRVGKPLLFRWAGRAEERDIA